MNNFNSGGYVNQSNSSYNNIDNVFNNVNQFEQQLQTNKWKVQNLQDALTRYAPPNSCGCYHCLVDGREYEYEIYTGHNGQKSYKVFERIPCENSITPNVDLEQILSRLIKLEEKINAKPTTSSADGVK